MLTHALVSAPLICLAGAQRAVPLPLAVAAQRPRVLARAPQGPHQLSLFAPPGGRR